MTKLEILITFCMAVFNTVYPQNQNNIVKSPDENIKVKLSLEKGEPHYNIHYKDNLFLEKSALGLHTSLGNFSDDLEQIAVNKKPIKESYNLKKAKVSYVNYSANEMASKFVNKNKDTLIITFRVSNRDVAYSYKVKTKSEKHNIKILNERSSFNIPNYATTYITPQAPPMTGWEKTKPSYEEAYTLNKKVGEPSTYGHGYTFPALFKLAKKGWVLLSETGVDSSYPGTRLSESNKDGEYKILFPQDGGNNGIGEPYSVQAAPAKTPWRTITLGPTLKPIVESTVAYDLVEQKYKPSIDYKMGRSTWSWIVWQNNSINYEDQIKFIDLASDLDFEYVLVDNWWDRNIGRDKIKDLVKYAKSKNIGVFLWYNSNGHWNEAPQTPRNKMNNIITRQKEMQWLENIGVKGIKVDFFGGDKQTTMKLYEDILTDANKYDLSVNFHGTTTPRGWSKMYPNYVTSEAVLASENLVFEQAAMDKHAKNATILPFTRNAVGPMDFGPVFLNKRLSENQKEGTKRKTTETFELATSILYFSPVQYFGLTPNNIKEQPDYVLDFLKNVPTVWDETKYLGGEPEDYAAIARRKNKDWYIAVVNGKKSKQEIELDVPMLKDRKFNLMYDNEDGTTGIKKIHTNDEKIKLELLPEGGNIIFTPKNKP